MKPAYIANLRMSSQALSEFEAYRSSPETQLSSLLICQSFLATFEDTNRASPNTEP